MPANLRLDDPHYAIQAVMGWNDFHPHVFEVGDAEHGPAPDDHDEEEDDETFEEPSAWAGEDRELTIAQALASSPGGITYVYDFAEDWRVDHGGSRNGSRHYWRRRLPRRGTQGTAAGITRARSLQQ